jgi:hypothetical protein
MSTYVVPTVVAAKPRFEMLAANHLDERCRVRSYR